MCWKIIFCQPICMSTYIFLLCNLHPQLSFIDKKCYFQSWSGLRLHFTQKCVASNFPLLPQRPFYSRFFYSSFLQSSPTGSLEVFLRSNMTLLLLFFVRGTDRIDDPFASVLLFLFLFWVVLLFLCLPAICFLLLWSFLLTHHNFCLSQLKDLEFSGLLPASNFYLSALSRTLIQVLWVNHFCGSGKQN